MNALANDDRQSKRLHILPAAEVAALYGLPQFTAEDQPRYFSLTADDPGLRQPVSSCVGVLQMYRARLEGPNARRLRKAPCCLLIQVVYG